LAATASTANNGAGSMPQSGFGIFIAISRLD
jgi:hypothetical protein